ncbi:uncharacterized protein ACJ7VT_022728 [Polymixia lowei]
MFMQYIVGLLVAGLCLSSSAPAPEDCPPLVAPLPLDEPSKILGRWIFIEGFTDHKMYDTILKTVNSSWISITPSTSSNNNSLILLDNDKTNGKCNMSASNLTISGNTVKFVHDTYSGVFQTLPTCPECLLLDINSTMKELDAPIHSLYILARSPVLNDSDLEVFRKQAECLQFPQNPSFHYDPKQELCPDGEVKNVISPPP